MPLIIKFKSRLCRIKSHQRLLKMFTLPKLILMPNNWPINTAVSSFVGVYFSTYLSPAWKKHFVSLSNQVFQRCELQLRVFLAMSILHKLSFNQWKSKNIKPKTSSQMYTFGATHFLPVIQPPLNLKKKCIESPRNFLKTDWKACCSRHTFWLTLYLRARPVPRP